MISPQLRELIQRAAELDLDQNDDARPERIERIVISSDTRPLLDEIPRDDLRRFARAVAMVAKAKELSGTRAYRRVANV